MLAAPKSPSRVGARHYCNIRPISPEQLQVEFVTILEFSEYVGDAGLPVRRRVGLRFLYRATAIQRGEPKENQRSRA